MPFQQSSPVFVPSHFIVYSVPTQQLIHDSSTTEFWNDVCNISGMFKSHILHTCTRCIIQTSFSHTTHLLFLAVDRCMIMERSRTSGLPSYLPRCIFNKKKFFLKFLCLFLLNDLRSSYDHLQINVAKQQRAHLQILPRDMNSSKFLKCHSTSIYCRALPSNFENSLTM